MNRFLTLATLDRLRVLEGRLTESKAKTQLLELKLDDPDLSTDDVFNISSSLEIIEADMIDCLNNVLLVEQEVGQILC